MKIPKGEIKFPKTEYMMSDLNDNTFFSNKPYKEDYKEDKGIITEMSLIKSAKMILIRIRRINTTMKRIKIQMVKIIYLLMK